MKSFFFLFILFLSANANSQIKTLIPADEEVNLPANDDKKIGITTTLDETVLDKHKIAGLFARHIMNNMNSDNYYIIDSSSNFIELFVVYPCKSFNLNDIHAHQIINEGLISSTILINFKDSSYDIHLKDYQWVNKSKKRFSIDDIYKTYQRNDDLPYKIKHYGILKSCEYSIAESLNNIILIIDDVIKEK